MAPMLNLIANLQKPATRRSRLLVDPSEAIEIPDKTLNSRIRFFMQSKKPLKIPYPQEEPLIEPAEISERLWDRNPTV